MTILKRMIAVTIQDEVNGTDLGFDPKAIELTDFSHLPSVRAKLQKQKESSKEYLTEKEKELKKLQQELAEIKAIQDEMEKLKQENETAKQLNQRVSELRKTVLTVRDEALVQFNGVNQNTTKADEEILELLAQKTNTTQQKDRRSAQDIAQLQAQQQRLQTDIKEAQEALDQAKKKSKENEERLQNELEKTKQLELAREQLREQLRKEQAEQAVLEKVSLVDSKKAQANSQARWKQTENHLKNELNTSLTYSKSSYVNDPKMLDDFILKLSGIKEIAGPLFELLEALKNTFALGLFVEKLFLQDHHSDLPDRCATALVSQWSKTQPYFKSMSTVFTNGQFERVMGALCNTIGREPAYSEYVFFTLCSTQLEPEPLAQVLETLRFNIHEGNSDLQRAFCDAFMVDQDGFCRLLNGLVMSRALVHFKPSMVAQYVDLDVKWASAYMGLEETLLTRLFNEQKGQPVDVLNLPFIQFATLGGQHNSKSGYEFVATLYNILRELKPVQQLEVLNDSNQSKLIKGLHERFLKVYNVYRSPYVLTSEQKRSQKQDDIAKHLKGFYDYCCGKIIEASKELKRQGFKISIDHSLVLLDGLLDINKDQLICIYNYTNTVGEYKNGAAAVQDVLDQSFLGSDPLKWSTKGLAGRLEYVYFQVRFPLEEYKEWFKTQNKALKYLTESEIEKIFQNYDSKRKAMTGYTEAVERGYRCMTPGQVVSITHGIEKADDGPVFLKVGTGQGKSLVLAMLSTHFANKGERVLQYTCYQHLAARDHGHFKPMYEAFNQKRKNLSLDAPNGERKGDQTSEITTGLQEGDTFKLPQITYANINTHFYMFNRYLSERSCNKHQFKGAREFFEVGTLLLDEFDPIILDAGSVGNTVIEFNHAGLFSLGNVSSYTMGSNDAFAAHVVQNSQVGRFFEQLKSEGFNELYTQWRGTVSTQNWQGHSGTDNLGITHSYIGGFAYEMSQGHFYGYVATLNALAYFKQATRLIGVSGSITSTGIDRFKTLFEKGAQDPTSESKYSSSQKKVHYVEIPSTQGPSTEQTGVNFCRISETNMANDLWIEKVEADILGAIQKKNSNFDFGQPVLVFGNKEAKTDWAALSTMVTRIAKDHNKKVQFILKESDLTEEAIRLATDPNYITLSSHVAGRGTDFKPSKVVNALGGLHVCIAYASDYECLIQEIGRTGRLGANGSHSILLKEPMPVLKNESITLDTFKEEVFLITKDIITRLCETRPYTKALWQRWVLFNAFLGTSSSWPNNDGFMEKSISDKADFIWKKFIAFDFKEEAKPISKPVSTDDVILDVNDNKPNITSRPNVDTKYPSSSTSSQRSRCTNAQKKAVGLCIVLGLGVAAVLMWYYWNSIKEKF